MLKIADQVFSVVESAFSAAIGFDQDGPFVWWDFDFRGEAKETDGMDWEPHLSSHALIRLPSLPDIAGSETLLKDDPDEDSNFMLYIHEHQPIYNCRLRFGAWRDGSLDFSLSGSTDLSCYAKYRGNHPVFLEHSLLFQGVTVAAASLSEADHWFDQFFNPQQFHGGIPREEGGFIFRFSDACA